MAVRLHGRRHPHYAHLNTRKYIDKGSGKRDKVAAEDLKKDFDTNHRKQLGHDVQFYEVNDKIMVA